MPKFDLRGFFAVILARAGMPTESLWLPTAETAIYINRSEDYVRRVLRYEVSVHQRHPRGRLYFHKHDLDRWLVANSIAPAS